MNWDSLRDKMEEKGIPLFGLCKLKRKESWSFWIVVRVN
jgi:hypothetical protein